MVCNKFTLYTFSEPEKMNRIMIVYLLICRCSEFVSFSSAFGAALGSTIGLSCIWCIIRVFRKLRSKGKC